MFKSQNVIVETPLHVVFNIKAENGEPLKSAKHDQDV
jgi:hypothetical protein